MKLNFKDFQGKRVALFTGGILDKGDEYELIDLKDAKKITIQAQNELSGVLLEYYDSGFISKALIRELIRTTRENPEHFTKVIRKRAKNDTLILTEGFLSGKDVSLKNRTEVSEKLEEVLRECAAIDSKLLLSSLNNTFEEILLR